MRKTRRIVALLIVSVFVTGCATSIERGQTAREKNAYRVFDRVCWNAGGPPTPGFFAGETGGELGMLVGGNIGVTQAQVDAVVACMNANGVSFRTKP